MHPPHSQGIVIHQRADDWIRTSMNLFTRQTAFSVEPRRHYAAIAASTSVRIRTPYVSFGGCLLSQEHTCRVVNRGDRAESNRYQTDSQSVSGNQHRTRPQRKERELNPQDVFTFDRLPTGSRHQSGGPSVFKHWPNQDSNLDCPGRSRV